MGILSSARFDAGESSISPASRIATGVAFVLLIVAVSIWVALNPQWVLSLGHWGYLGAFLIGLVSSATIILPAPGIALLMAMGTVLDPLLVAVVAAIGSALGELTGYVAGATGAALVPSDQRAHFERIHFFTGKYGALTIFALAVIPFPLFDLVGIIAGMLRIPVILFLAVVFAGNSMKYTFLIWLGAGPISFLLHFLYSLLLRA